MRGDGQKKFGKNGKITVAAILGDDPAIATPIIAR
jgi:hypothetical protein